MKAHRLVTACLLLAGCSLPDSPLPRSAALSTSPAGNGVLVELFTSEGCSSCPPADRTLAELSRQGVDGTAVLGLEFHVDYWDRLGWADPFMLPGASQRQEHYRRQFKTESLYTPQAVVDGQAELVGSHADQLRGEIARAARRPHGTLRIQASRGQWRIQLSNLPTGAEPRRLWLALAQDNLQSDPTRGENQGAQLVHTGVVRSLQPLGEVPASARDFSTQVAPPDHHLWPSNALRAVFFVQSDSGRVDAAAQASLASLMPTP